ncbi:hypothetical protein GQ43DRAFT_407850 [Delitschia confertaspora ATCC 74209]|uniref:FHF complex subunit HOOK-interacting protein C-terminal domain-containing protein n=1 Tax=Delitschia confertaspora ATCC 74209 TaxID=1513339 RepID=A0A9P4MTH5_9PLEO|nr:hypothetical protein GQ43DRAFT_407850 [Delitschia confertaspora ATCC 74209]
MDFWRSLLGGSSQKRQAAVNNPQQRLARFKRVYSDIVQTWHKTPTLANDAPAMVHIRMGFQRITTILNDESRSPAPHLCLSFASSQRIYTAVSKIAATACNEGIVRDAVAVFGALIDSEEEDFLENEQFAQALMNFIGRISGSGNMGLGEDTEAEIVELLFGISAKIRLQPEILPIWFTSPAPELHCRGGNQGIDFAGVTQKEDFPLCYQLIDHVHHEGRIGDFARTGLLYIFESASKSPDLEQWVVGSDLPTLMATGLGALYSQLSRKLSILHPKENLPLILSFSDYSEMTVPAEAESLFSPDFQVHISTFLSYLTFWQDVLEHCRSEDVRQTLIDHFQVLFLQQLLYPSLLESSDMDGGSSVAVLTYLRRILDALDHPELIHMILHYLLALPDWANGSHTPKSPVAAKRRMSLMLLNEPDNEDDRMNPSLFNLVDLVLSSTLSKNSQTVIAALKLITVILGKHHGYAIGTLVKIVDVHHKDLHRTVGALNAEMETYLGLALALAGETGADEAYENHLKDKLSILESHPCSLKMLGLPNCSLQTTSFFNAQGPRDVGPHYLILEDPLFKSLLDLLLTFMTNDVETNLALTEAIITLGACAQLRLEGWLCVDPSEYHFDENIDQEPEHFENENLRDMYKASRQPIWSSSAAPPLLACLQSLQAQVDALRTNIQDFDEHLLNRKQAFRIHQEITDAAKSTPSQPPSIRPSSEAPPVRTWTPQIPKYVLDSSATPSRTQSPRGRKEGMDQRHLSNSSPASPAPSKLGGQTLVSSPSRGMSPLPAPQPAHRERTLMADVLTSLTEVASSEALKRRIKFRKCGESGEVEVITSNPPVPSKDNAEITSDADAERAKGDNSREASLGHVLTNLTILQEFVLELVALLQVRATLFNEVRFV